MLDADSKAYLLNDLQAARDAMVSSLEGHSEYNVRRPLTPTGTNLLGLIKHLATWEARYLGDVFDRPFPVPVPQWDDATAWGSDMWVTADETRNDIVDFYRRVCTHADATVAELNLDSPGHVPWWSLPDVKLFNVLVHMIKETSRHAGHVDILKEQLDAASGAPITDPYNRGADYWANHCDTIEAAAQAAAERYD